MCLYPKLIRNRKYIANKKNKGIVPKCTDPRVKWVPVGCQQCMECKKQKARSWGVRLQEHIRTDTTGQFVTLTFSNESIASLRSEIKGVDGYELDNEIATLAVRRFLERWRKHHKKSVTHWLITELGQSQNAKYQGTENLHLHGFIFNRDKEAIKKIWGYGYVYIGDYVSARTVNYCMKYVHKTDLLHTAYNPKIFTSPGIGAKYIGTVNARLNQYKINGETDETYTTKRGNRINLPIYYRNKIYSETERESLWIEKLDKAVRYVDGKKVSIRDTEETYFKLLKQAQAKNKRLGFGTGTITWERMQYEYQRRALLYEKRIKIAEKKLAQLEKP